MQASDSTSHGSSISHHLRAIKGILQDVEYVWNRYDILLRVTEVLVCSVVNTTLSQTEVGPTNEIHLWAVTHAFSLLGSSSRTGRFPCPPPDPILE